MSGVWATLFPSRSIGTLESASIPLKRSRWASGQAARTGPQAGLQVNDGLRWLMAQTRPPMFCYVNNSYKRRWDKV